MLETEFDDLKRVAGPRLSEMLRQVPVWVRWNAHDPGMPSAVAFYYGYEANVLARAGREPLMTNSIEIVSLKTIGQLRPPGSKFQQVITLHEMAHAIQRLAFTQAEQDAIYRFTIRSKSSTRERIVNRGSRANHH